MMWQRDVDKLSEGREPRLPSGVGWPTSLGAIFPRGEVGFFMMRYGVSMVVLVGGGSARRIVDERQRRRKHRSRRLHPSSQPPDIYLCMEISIHPSYPIR